MRSTLSLLVPFDVMIVRSFELLLWLLLFESSLAVLALDLSI